MFSLTVCVFIIVAGLAYYTLKPSERQIDLPGPWGLPLLGNILQLESSFYRTLVKWSKKYGPLCKFRMGRKTTVIVGDPVIAKEMLALDAFSGRAYINEFILFEGENIGLLNAQGPTWEEQRRFIIRQLRDFGFGKSSMESVMIEEVNELAARFAAFEGKPVYDIKNELSLALVNSLWSIVAGTRYSQDDPKLRHLAHQLSGAFDEAAKSGGILAFIPAVKYVIPELSGYNAIRRLMSGLAEFVGNTIKTHKENFQEDSPRDFIDVYLKEIKNTSDSSSSFYGAAAEKQLIGVVADLFQAGTDSTSSTLNWGVLYLLKMPEIQRKLQAEIKSVTGNSRPVSLSDRPNMPYTLAFISELLRKSNAPFGVPHKVLFDTEFRGVFFPKDTFIMINLEYCHNDPKLWGGDPENFRPERFLTSDGKSSLRNLNPFLVGRRQCPGETLARDGIFIFLTNLIQKFNIVADPNSPEPDLEPAVSFMIQAKPYKVVFEERQD